MQPMTHPATGPCASRDATRAEVAEAMNKTPRYVASRNGSGIGTTANSDVAPMTPTENRATNVMAPRPNPLPNPAVRDAESLSTRRWGAERITWDQYHAEPLSENPSRILK